MKKLIKFLKEAHKGQKYNGKDYFDYHLMGVGEMAVDKAIYAGLDTGIAFALALSHDVWEDNPDYVMDNQSVLVEALCEIVGNKRYYSLMTDIFILSKTEDESYYDYIKRLKGEYVLIVKEADLEFNLQQSNWSNFPKHELYKFALDIIRMKRIL